ncbi:ABC transporter permease [Reinekea sp. G2M2-21]|uniref:ABC transporter permease n=1 Tax=Reinekea sp. G2M2-21 TaxID=2788942 RepID=UPI0018AB7B31|nr:ABC transporter permease [Reinekea sp. G2M2-21]
MSVFWLGVQREWRRILTQPTYWASLFLLPLLAFVTVNGVISTPSVNNVALDIVDLDRSAASRDLQFRLDASSSISIADQLPDAHRALQRAQDKTTFGYLIIPADYQRQLIAGEQVSINVFVNQQNFMLGNTISSQVLRQVIESSLRDSASALMVGGQMKEQALANVLPIKSARSVLGNSYLNYRTFLLATMLPHLWHVLVMVVTVIALGKEFKDGTIEQWYRASGNHLSLALTSKLLIPAVVLALWIGLIDVAIFAENNAGGYASLPSLLVASWLTQFCYHTAGLLVVALTANYRQALSLAAFYTTPAFAFIGVTFPTFNMNWVSQLWLAFLPIGILVRCQNAILHWQQNLFDVWPQLSIVAVFALCFGVLGMMLLRSKVSRQELWHQH